MEDLLVKRAKKFDLILQQMSTLIRLESHNHADFKASKTTSLKTAAWNLNWPVGQNSKLSIDKKLLIYKAAKANMDLRHTTVGCQECL